MPERYFLIVHCEKSETYFPINLSGPPNLEVHRVGEISKNSPCLKHNGTMERVGNHKLVAHDSVSILVSVEATPLSRKSELEFMAIDKAILLELKQRKRKKPASS